jgi:transcriptional regulator with XRE-family HTH domain
MLDSTSFLTRLKSILDHYELSSSAFADAINVQRSSISHLLKGRNKPSLEFIMKIDEAFSEVDLQWLLYGTGTFPKTSNKIAPTEQKVEVKNFDKKNKRSLDRIVIFYSDGTFEDYIGS